MLLQVFSFNIKKRRISAGEVSVKLDQVEKAVNKLNRKMDNFYNKLDDLNLRLVNVEEKSNARCKKIKTMFSFKAEDR